MTRSLEDNSTAMHSQPEQQSNSTTPDSTSSYPTSSESTTTPLPDQCPQPNVTSATNDTVVLQHLKQLRLTSIRAQILARFGLSDPPDNSESSSPMDEEKMATYYQFLSASGGQRMGRREEEEECGAIRGEKSSIYAKELRLHFPSSFHPIVPSIEAFEWGENNDIIIVHVCVCMQCVYTCMYASISVCVLDVVLIK